MTDQITIDVDTLRLLSPACKAELASHLGFDSLQSSGGGQGGENNEEGEYAELGLQAARAFLHGCGEKTTATIAKIVEAGDTFSLRQLERDMDVPVGGLRGVWTGLTKRVHTITNDYDVDLIEWLDETDDDWIARLMPATRESFRRALAE
jgi:hypothetical protein